MNKKKKSNKKKLLAIFLFLFALSGVVGYGAYSYYWTRGSYDTDSETINIIAFDPEVSTYNDNYAFLGNSASLELDCEKNQSNGKETIVCSADADIRNDGGTNIRVEVDDEEIELDAPNGVDVDYSGASFYISSNELAPGERTTLYITVPLVIDNGTTSGDGGYEGVEVHAPVSGGDITVSASFTLTATQIQD